MSVSMKSRLPSTKISSSPVMPAATRQNRAAKSAAARSDEAYKSSNVAPKPSGQAASGNLTKRLSAVTSTVASAKGKKLGGKIEATVSSQPLVSSKELPPLTEEQKSRRAPAKQQSKKLDARNIGLAGIALQPLAALGVETGVFVIAAIPSTDAQLERFARFTEVPLPHLIPSTSNDFISAQQLSGVSIYVAYVPWPDHPNGIVKMGAINADGKKILFEVNCLSWGRSDSRLMADLFKRYGNVLAPALKAALPSNHSLVLALTPRESAHPKTSEVSRPNSSESVRGNFDGIVDEMAHGWVFNSENPGERLTVEVLCDSEVVATGFANNYRDDLESNGIGDGCYHFRLALSNDLFDGRSHELTVRVVDTGTLLNGRATTTLVKRKSKVDQLTRANLLSLLTNLVEANPNWTSIERARMLADCRAASFQQEIGNFISARQAYRDITDQLGANAACACKIAETFLLEGDVVSAQSEYRAAIKLNDQFSWAQLGYGNALRIAGDFVAAYSAYSTAAELDPSLTEAKLRRAEVSAAAAMAKISTFTKNGQITEASSAAVQAAIENPNDDALIGVCEAAITAKLQEFKDGNSVPIGTHLHELIRTRNLLDAVLDEIIWRMK